jgi:hypothetical protein
MVARRAPARVITVLNLKGGVGKTHACWLLASVAQARGQRVLLADLDTQGNLSMSFVGPDGLQDSRQACLAGVSGQGIQLTAQEGGHVFARPGALADGDGVSRMSVGGGMIGREVGQATGKARNHGW